MTTKNLVKQVREKQEDGSMGSPYDIGSSFGNIVDDATGYSLAQFFENYMSFMQNTTFVYSGKTTPKNSHIGIWIDTNKPAYPFS